MQGTGAPCRCTTPAVIRAAATPRRSTLESIAAAGRFGSPPKAFATVGRAPRNPALMQRARGTARGRVRSSGMAEPHPETLHDLVDLIPHLRGYAHALTRDPADADDLVQETLLKALASIDSYTPGTKLRAWLFTIMRNTFFTAAKKRRREQPGAEDCASRLAVAPPSQETHLLGSQLLAAINRLPDHYREALVLVVVLGESYESAASIAGCAMGTIKSRVNRARRMVIDALGEAPARPPPRGRRATPGQEQSRRG